MSVYSNQQIRQAIVDSHIVCHPFSEGSVSKAGLDVALGYYYYRTETAGGRTLYNPFDREDVEQYFDGPYKARRHGEWCQQKGFRPVVGIPESHPIIALKPGERILAHTHEFFGILPPGAAEIKATTPWTQSGIIVRGSWLEAGRIGRVTLEICNNNQAEIVLLPVGERIAHVVFHEMKAVDTTQTAGVENTGQTRTVADLETIIKTWSPSLILPQIHHDQHALPPKIEGMSYD